MTREMLGNKTKHYCLRIQAFVLTLLILVLINSRLSRFSQTQHLRIFRLHGVTDKGFAFIPWAEVDFRIIVLAFNRAESLARCLTSLNEAEYDGDSVHVDVWIDRSNEDATIDNQTYMAASRFHFIHGTVEVHEHPKHVGLYGQWLGTWRPKENTKEIAVILEDDVTVSKYFYKWLKLVHKKYDSLPHINGFSTNGRGIKHAGDKGWLQAPEEEVVFSYPVLGTWGFSPSVKNWLSFLKWYDHASGDKSFVPSVPGILPTKWYRDQVRSGNGENMWSMWHIYYAFIRNELTIYPNLPNGQGLTVNWRDPGLHFKGRSLGPAGPLLQTWKEQYSDLADVPVQLDAHGKVVKQSQRDI